MSNKNIILIYTLAHSTENEEQSKNSHLMVNSRIKRSC